MVPVARILLAEEVPQFVAGEYSSSETTPYQSLSASWSVTETGGAFPEYQCSFNDSVFLPLDIYTMYCDAFEISFSTGAHLFGTWNWWGSAGGAVTGKATKPPVPTVTAHYGYVGVYSIFGNSGMSASRELRYTYNAAYPWEKRSLPSGSWTSAGTGDHAVFADKSGLLLAIGGTLYASKYAAKENPEDPNVLLPLPTLPTVTMTVAPAHFHGSWTIEEDVYPARTRILIAEQAGTGTARSAILLGEEAG